MTQSKETNPLIYVDVQSDESDYKNTAPAEALEIVRYAAREKLILLSNMKNLERLHQKDAEDDLFELVQYVKTNGQAKVTQKQTNSRALGVKPFSTATEEAFLQNLTHALENIWLSQSA